MVNALPELRTILQRYAMALMTQIARGAACNRATDSREREARRVRSHGARSQAPRGRDRRADASRSRTSTSSCTRGPGSRRAGDRLLHADRAGPAAASRRPPADAQALSDGVEGEPFYEKRCPQHRPQWVRDAPVWSGRNEGDIDFCLCRRPPDARLAGQPRRPGDAHAVGARLGRPRADADRVRPRPGRAGHHRRVRARRPRASAGFDHLGLQAFPKTSGSKGMQVYLPLNTPGVT